MENSAPKSAVCQYGSYKTYVWSDNTIG